MDRFREKVYDLYNDTGFHSDQEIVATAKEQEKWLALVNRVYYECYLHPQANTMLIDHDRYSLGLKIMKAYDLLTHTAIYLFRLSRGCWAAEKLGNKIIRPCEVVHFTDTAPFEQAEKNLLLIRWKMVVYDEFASMYSVKNRTCPLYWKYLKESL